VGLRGGSLARIGRPADVVEDSYLGLIHMPDDGARIAAGAEDKTVRLYDVLSGKTIRLIRAAESVVSIAFSLDAGRFAAGTWDGRILCRMRPPVTRRL